MLQCTTVRNSNWAATKSAELNTALIDFRVLKSALGKVLSTEV
jgi:hypothetical protein